MEVETLAAMIIENEARERAAIEQRFHPSSEADFIRLFSGGGMALGAYDALTCPSVASGVIGLTEALAMLPGHVYRRIDARNKERVANHPVEQLFQRRWNPITTAYDGRQVFFSNLVFSKAAYAQIVRDRGGRVRELWNIPAHAMQEVKRRGRSLSFRFVTDDGDGIAREVTLTHEQMLWCNAFHMDGEMGLDPVRLHERTFAASIAIEDYLRNFFSSGGNLRMALKYAQRLSDEDYKRLASRWPEVNKDPNKVAILDNGASAENIGVPPDKAQMKDARIAQVQDNARAIRVPPSRVGEHSNSTLKNVEQQNIEWVVTSIGPKVANAESSINMQLFSEREQDQGLFFEFSLEGLLRGDTLSRFQAYGLGIQNGWLLRNEVRALENLNPKEGLDEPLVPGNMAAATNILSDQE